MERKIGWSWLGLVLGAFLGAMAFIFCIGPVVIMIPAPGHPGEVIPQLVIGVGIFCVVAPSVCMALFTNPGEW